MRTTPIAEYGWFISSPADILRRVDVAVPLVTTGTAPKLGLAVLLLAVAATAARASGIVRIGRHYRNAPWSGFIFQKQPQLRENSRVQNGSWLLPALDPFAHAIPVFDGDT